MGGATAAAGMIGCARINKMISSVKIQQIMCILITRVM